MSITQKIPRLQVPKLRDKRGGFMVYLKIIF